MNIDWFLHLRIRLQEVPAIGGRYALRNGQWDAIKGLLARREEAVGDTAQNNRLFIDAILYRYSVGIAWQDLPERFGG